MTTSRGITIDRGGRSIGRIEKMVRVAEEGYTLRFATSATIEGEVDTARLRRALDALARRHPLLSSAIVGDRFVFGAGAPLALSITDAPVEGTDAIVEAELRHRPWDPAEPRARCVLVRHGDRLSTLVLSFDHLVSDGGSGVLAMRDLLERLVDDEASDQPLPAPPQDSLLPTGRGGLADLARALGHARTQGGRPPPFRPKTGPRVPPGERTTRIHPLRFSREDSAALARFGRRAGATVHGVVVAAIVIAHAELRDSNGATPVRVMHPVDMRRYLASVTGRDPVGDAIGYYVSSVETDHVIGATSFADLAQEITIAVRSAKERGEPFLSAPAGGRLLVLLRALLGAERFRDFAESRLLASTTSVTNLGALERLGIRPTFGPLRVRRFGFVASPSIFGAVCASVSSFDGELEIVMHHVEPRVDAATGARLAGTVERLLRSLCP